MTLEASKSLKYLTYGMYAMTGLVGALYFYLDIKQTERELKQLESDLNKLLRQTEDEKKNQKLIFEQKVVPAVQKTNSSSQLSGQIYCICITGGPGSGRTSAFTILKERLQEFQYNVLIVPFDEYCTANQTREIASTLPATEMHKIIIKQLIVMQNLLDYWKELATMTQNKDTVILCQGGILDILTHYDLSSQFYDDLSEEYEPLATIRDKNYDAIIHLVTNADGLQNNFNYGDTFTNRQADIEKAIKIDKAIQKIWTGHPNHFVIDNRGGNFDKKIEKTYRTVQRLLGLKQTNIRCIKYQLDNINIPEDYFTKKIELTDIFILDTNSENEAERVRIRQIEGGVKQYYHITKKKTQGDQLQILRRFISTAEAQYLLQNSDREFKLLKRSRICFTYQNQYCFTLFRLMQVDIYKDQNIGILRMGLSENNPLGTFPNWLKVNKRVDDNPKYDSFQLATLFKRQMTKLKY